MHCLAVRHLLSLEKSLTRQKMDFKLNTNLLGVFLGSFRRNDYITSATCIERMSYLWINISFYFGNFRSFNCL